MAIEQQDQQSDAAVQPLKSGQTESQDSNAAWITVGRIVAAQGLAGEVRVYPESDFPDRFLVAGDRWLRYPGKPEPELVKLKKGRYIPKKNLYIVKFEGINYRDQAEALRDVELLVPESDRPELDEGEFHVMDLVGLEVFLQDTGESIGRVVDLISVGNDLLEIELPMPTPDGEDRAAQSTPTAGAEESPPAPSGASASEQQSDGEPSVSNLSEKEIKAQEKANFTRRKGRRKAARERKKAARPKKAPRLLVPFVHDIVPVVDLEAGRIEITPPPGLLDLSR